MDNAPDSSVLVVDLVDLQRSPELRRFNEDLHACAATNPGNLESLVLARLKQESEALVGSPVLRPWVKDILRAESLAEAASRVLARKICGAEAGLEMDVEVGGLNSRVDYLVPLFQACLEVNCPCLSLDLLAIVTQDPAASGYLHPFLFYKGFHAGALQRIGHQLWVRSGDNAAVEALRAPYVDHFSTGQGSAAWAGRAAKLEALVSEAEARFTALWIQCRSSEVFGVDIHPGARLGKRLFMDHATGLVIGETATVGDGVSILHAVTLGGTGKPTPSLLRHPQVGDGVTIGSSSSVLGCIIVGHGATVGAQAVVTKAVPAGATVVGLNKILTAKDEEQTKQKGRNEGTWWAETDSDYYTI